MASSSRFDRATRRLALAVVLAGLLLAGACADTDEGFADDDFQDEFQEEGFADDEFAEDESQSNVAGGAGSDCETELGDDAEFYWLGAYRVVDGELGELCFGQDDQTLVDAWEALSAMSPKGQLTDLGLFAGFESPDAGDEVTLAFVNALDDDGNQFQMSINLPVADEDPDELLLTMAHEFTHVFTSTVTQMDRSAEAEFDCDTYYNGEACYYEDSLMWAWIDEFWGELAAEVDPFADASAADGEDRCEREPQFLGAYAASTPEEDFAESFAAYVFDVPAPTDEVQAKLDWIDAQPGLSEFRDRAIDAGMGPLVGNFDICG
ncbi:MAG: hypothetical protein KDB16_11440 [Acidimicrobiales bacterium]|nr:hypothetical protein [Acidimicrobiales bacterium]